ncbi:MAG: bifunctional hydroxymethylpyrimidine kinase/phosphomethylpyrimidine kinase, partial [Erysipelotrichaceae bacterium]|nr:bifunctional hydroxymethylpyrimidine kinase/phosphomethylpyrimidine kinase [Erysipelotrichaceae bacterium]
IRIRTHYDHPADIRSSIGGVMHNIITNYVKLGGNSRLITAFSDDSYGNMIVQDCKSSGIDISDSLFVKNRSSGIFMQIMDENNDMYLAICDMSILESVTPEFIQSKKHILLGSRLVVIDPSLPIETIKEIIAICKDKVKLYIDPISDNYALKIKDLVGDFDLIKPNLTELENLCGKKIRNDEEAIEAAEELIGKGLKKAVISRAEDGVIYVDEERVINRRFKAETRMVNASGAGDALMSALIYGEINGLPIDDTIDYGLAAGIAAIRSEKTINDNFSIDLLEEIIKETKGQ